MQSRLVGIIKTSVNSPVTFTLIAMTVTNIVTIDWSIKLLQPEVYFTNELPKYQ